MIFENENNENRLIILVTQLYHEQNEYKTYWNNGELSNVDTFPSVNESDFKGFSCFWQANSGLVVISGDNLNIDIFSPSDDKLLNYYNDNTDMIKLTKKINSFIDKKIDYTTIVALHWANNQFFNFVSEKIKKENKSIDNMKLKDYLKNKPFENLAAQIDGLSDNLDDIFLLHRRVPCVTYSLNGDKSILLKDEINAVVRSFNNKSKSDFIEAYNKMWTKLTSMVYSIVLRGMVNNSRILVSILSQNMKSPQNQILTKDVVKTIIDSFKYLFLMSDVKEEILHEKIRELDMKYVNLVRKTIFKSGKEKDKLKSLIELIDNKYTPDTSGFSSAECLQYLNGFKSFLDKIIDFNFGATNVD